MLIFPAVWAAPGPLPNFGTPPLFLTWSGPDSAILYTLALYSSVQRVLLYRVLQLVKPAVLLVLCLAEFLHVYVDHFVQLVQHLRLLGFSSVEPLAKENLLVGDA